MSTLGARDPIAATLARLTPLTVDASRAESVRRRARARLEDHATRTRHPSAAESWTAAPLLLSGFCVLYAVALLGTALRVAGWLP